MKSYTHLPDRLGKIKVSVAISDIIDAETNPRAIQVVIAATGRPAWIPRAVEPEFLPGCVRIPIWLYNKIFDVREV